MICHNFSITRITAKWWIRDYNITFIQQIQTFLITKISITLYGIVMMNSR